LQTTAATSTYAAGSQQLSFYNAMNVARLAAGAGAVNQSAALDTAAQAHASYLTTNMVAVGVTHEEDSTLVGYYGATLSSRISKAGFSAGFSTEVIGGTGASMSAADCLYGLLNTVYHGAALLSQETSVGVGIGSDVAGVPMCVADMATASTDTLGQVPASGSFIAYPYGGQTNVFEIFYAGYESPRPPVSLFPNTTAGTPVIVRVRNADYMNYLAAGTLKVVVSQFVLKDAGGNAVPSGILAASDVTAGTGVTLNADTNLDSGFAVLVPLSPLAKGQTYTYTFTASLKTGDTPVTITKSFTTNP